MIETAELGEVSPVLVIVGLGIAFLGVDVLERLDERVEFLRWLPEDDSGIVRSNVRKWIATTILIVFVVLVEGQSLTTIGFESMPAAGFVGWVLGGTVGMVLFVYAVAILWEQVGPGFPDENETAERLKRGSAGLRAFTAITAGVTESILMQGYSIERLVGLVGNVPVAAAIAIVAFAAVHYDTDRGLSVTAFKTFPAIWLVGVYVLTGNVFVVIAIHIVVDGIELFLVPADDGMESHEESATPC